MSAACGDLSPATDAPDAGDTGSDAGAAADADPSAACAAGPEGLDCLFDLIDRASSGCDPADLARLADSLEPRVGALALWHNGTAAFFSRGQPVAIAGEFNGWDATALATQAVCDSDWHVALAPVASGHYPYKVVDGDVWSIDPLNDAFAYDGFTGNPDGKNSVLNTYDSGRGHLVAPRDPMCDTLLDNCRAITAYLPPGYGAPDSAARSYPVVYMHDGQNIFDDGDCCFGHGGWEVNITLDAEIAAGRVGDVIVVGADHAGGDRFSEYGVSAAGGGRQEMFMSFQVNVVQATAEARWRIDPTRRYTAGSSLGGVIAFRLALAFPDIYAGAASLSGTMWINEETGTSIADLVEDSGHVPVALYFDHGGSAATGADNYEANVALKDVLAATGWSISTSPDCTASPSTACYHHELNATHDELAWRDRSWRWLRYLVP